jgi:hypothetical protein
VPEANPLKNPLMLVATNTPLLLIPYVYTGEGLDTVMVPVDNTQVGWLTVAEGVVGMVNLGLITTGVAGEMQPAAFLEVTL